MTKDYTFTLEIIVNRNKEIVDIEYNKLRNIEWLDEIND